MGRWTDYEIQRDFTDWADLCDAHNADCDAYEATIAALSKTCTDLEAEREYNAGLVAERDSLARRINPDGTPVDIAALCVEIDTVTDERDEWKRRCERLVLALSEHGYTPEAVACIAEGRDNG